MWWDPTTSVSVTGEVLLNVKNWIFLLKHKFSIHFSNKETGFCDVRRRKLRREIVSSVSGRSVGRRGARAASRKQLSVGSGVESAVGKSENSPAAVRISAHKLWPNFHSRQVINSSSGFPFFLLALNVNRLKDMIWNMEILILIEWNSFCYCTISKIYYRAEDKWVW